MTRLHLALPLNSITLAMCLAACGDGDPSIEDDAASDAGPDAVSDSGLDECETANDNLLALVDARTDAGDAWAESLAMSCATDLLPDQTFVSSAMADVAAIVLDDGRVDLASAELELVYDDANYRSLLLRFEGDVVEAVSSGSFEWPPIHDRIRDPEAPASIEFSEGLGETLVRVALRHPVRAELLADA